MRLNVEANEVRAQQSFDQFALPGANPEHFRVGPGNVPENRHPGVGPDVFHHAWNERQVIVLRQENRGVHIRHLLQNGVGEALVDPLVLQPVFRAENRTGVRDVAKRPEAFV